MSKQNLKEQKSNRLCHASKMNDKRFNWGIPFNWGIGSKRGDEATIMYHLKIFNMSSHHVCCIQIKLSKTILRTTEELSRNHVLRQFVRVILRLNSKISIRQFKVKW